MTEVVSTFWKSSHSTGEGNCVEVADTATGGRAVRDSKDPARPMLTFGPGGWRAFLAGAQAEASGHSVRG